MKAKIASIAVISGLPLVAWGGANPCAPIKAACEAAGYKHGAHNAGKGLGKDCIHPIVSGQTVAGVTVSPNDLAACKAQMEKAPRHGKEPQGPKSGTAPAQP
jgi:hypothetical protein